MNPTLALSIYFCYRAAEEPVPADLAAVMLDMGFDVETLDNTEFQVMMTVVPVPAGDDIAEAFSAPFIN